jgi:hypothetical protein
MIVKTIKVMASCLFSWQVKLAALDISHRQECLIKTGELKHHVKELEKQVSDFSVTILYLDQKCEIIQTCSCDTKS